MFNKSFKVIRQLDVMDCGPTCLMMIGLHHGKKYSLNHLRGLCNKGQQGVTLLAINRAAQELGYKTLPLKLSVDLFVKQAKLLCIVHWQGDHYVAVHKIKGEKVYIADPGGGKATMDKDELAQMWTMDGENGIALFVETNPKVNQEYAEQTKPQGGMRRLGGHLLQFKKFLGQLGLGALLGSVLNLIFPF
jgi:ATP-binding cassette subfamily B protein